MKIAVVSDTHDRVAVVAQALAKIAVRQVDWILHCGDIESPATASLFPTNTHFVYGNCDTERQELRDAITDIGATLHEPFGHLELEGLNLAFLHGDDQRLFQDLQASAAFDFLFHGHTHVARDQVVGKTRIINPGALHRAAPKSFLILDLPSGQAERIELP
jgi:hypothetical protein